jgi:long-subunit fatty acid transport protein
MKGGLTRFAAVIAALSLAGLASAQTDIEANAGAQLDLTRPGARSLGMGGAFAALADDATAALQNPAGLPTLGKPEVSIEGRSMKLETPYTQGGRLLGTPTNVGVDTVSGLVRGNATSDLNRVDWASVVLPKGGFAIAGYYWSAAAVDTTFRTNGPFSGDLRAYPADNSLSYDIKGVGAAIAYHLKSGISVGVGATHYDFSIHSLTRRYGFTAINCGTCDGVGQVYGAPNFTPAAVNNQQTQDGTDQTWGFNFGVLAQMSRKLQIGYGIRISPKFKFQAVNRGGAELGDENVITKSVSGTFHVPDVLAVGIVYRPSEALTISTEYKRVRYSTLLDGYALVLAYPAPPPAGADYKADDGSEFHGGLEYAIKADKNRFFLRGGAWYDPQHTVYFVGGASVGGGFPTLRLPKSDSEMHGTGGLGIDFGGRLAFDGAVDVSTRLTVAGASATLRF